MDMSDQLELLEVARREAEAIVAEAEEQATRLTAAAEQRNKHLAEDSRQLRSAGQELALNLERTIALLTQILTELRNQIG